MVRLALISGTQACEVPGFCISFLCRLRQLGKQLLLSDNEAPGHIVNHQFQLPSITGSLEHTEAACAWPSPQPRL